MTLLATTFVATPHFHLAGWVQFVLFVIPAIAGLVLLESKELLPEGAALKRLTIGLVLAVALLTIGAGVMRAAGEVYISCGGWITYLDWIFWIC